MTWIKPSLTDYDKPSEEKMMLNKIHSLYVCRMVQV